MPCILTTGNGLPALEPPGQKFRARRAPREPPPRPRNDASLGRRARRASLVFGAAAQRLARAARQLEDTGAARDQGGDGSLILKRSLGVLDRRGRERSTHRGRYALGVTRETRAERVSPASLFRCAEYAAPRRLSSIMFRALVPHLCTGLKSEPSLTRAKEILTLKVYGLICTPWRTTQYGAAFPTNLGPRTREPERTST